VSSSYSPKKWLLLLLKAKNIMAENAAREMEVKILLWKNHKWI
jgi:hypothetical protein